MDRTPRNLFLLLLGCTLLFHPASLLAESKASLTDSKNRPLRALAQGPTEGLKTGLAKGEWQRLRLVALSRRLDRDLADFEAASQWQSFLRMPQDLMILKNGARAGREEHSLNTSLERFALIAEEGQYQKIASLASFQAMHRALQTYAGSHNEIDSQPVESSVARRSEDRTQQWDDLETEQASKSRIDRLPPVLISGEQPDLLTPPDPSQVR